MIKISNQLNIKKLKKRRDRRQTKMQMKAIEMELCESYNSYNNGMAYDR